jgi:hypothetical protein
MTARKKRQSRDVGDKDTEAIREKHRKHIAKISKDINTSFYDTTPEEQVKKLFSGSKDNWPNMVVK